MGNNIKNVIEINGKRYDAVTGSLLGDAAAPQKARPVQSAAPGRFVDGFSRTSRLAAAPAPAPKKAAAATRSSHTQAVHVTAHKPEPARTLMRTAVKKPAIQSPAQLKAQTRTDILAGVPQHVVAPKQSHASVNPKRLRKASQMVQSPSVSRYGSASAPASSSIATHFSQPAARGIRPRSDFHAAPAAHKSAMPHIPVAREASHAKRPDMFEQALARAKSHEQKYEGNQRGGKKSRRLTSLATAVMCLLLIGGIIAYFNAPALSLRMASSKAGFNAKLPGYSPAGYSFGDLSYSQGNVTVSYIAENSSSKFDITQRTSDWDSQALLTNFVASANKAYQTYERAGRTIYFFGNNTATWVDSGVWYTVNGNNSLNKNQLLDLAGSI